MATATAKRTATKMGENNHSEYDWGEETHEKLTQLAFQLTRTTDDRQLTTIKSTYRDILRAVYKSDNNDNLYAALVLPIHTRDMISGKGEYELYYVLIGELCLFHDEQINDATTEKTEKIEKILNLLITATIDLDEEHPYGSWKDMKYLLNYLRDLYGEETLIEKPVFHHIVDLVSDQLREDITSTTNTSISLCAKWVPREKSKKFGWQTRYFAIDYFNDYYNATDLSERKCLTHFRKLVAHLNKKLQTPQINQCNQTWSNINFDKHVTSITLSRQKHAFQNVDKDGTLYPPSVDRLKCRENYLDYIRRCKEKLTTIKAARVGTVDMVREALRIYNANDCRNETNADALNMQWDEAGKSLAPLGNFIAMVDTSHSMTAENKNPLHAAIGLGIRIAEQSKLGKRIMTFSKNPQWIELDEDAPFHENVGKIATDSSWQLNTNFEAAMRLLLRTCITKDLHPDEVKNMVLVVFSDMAIDEADRNARSMHELIKTLFSDAGKYTTHQLPYEPCHILYWNLRSTNGFPSLSTEKNVSMLSGYSPAMLNQFCEKGIAALEDFTPWACLWEQLNHLRYQWVRNVL